MRFRHFLRIRWLFLVFSLFIPASMAVRLILVMMSESALTFSRGCG